MARIGNAFLSQISTSGARAGGHENSGVMRPYVNGPGQATSRIERQGPFALIFIVELQIHEELSDGVLFFCSRWCFRGRLGEIGCFLGWFRLVARDRGSRRWAPVGLPLPAWPGAVHHRVG